MSDHWPSSDELLLADRIAAAKLRSPLAPTGEARVAGEDEANAAAAAIVLAETYGDQPAGGIDGHADDDQVIEDKDNEPVPADL